MYGVKVFGQSSYIWRNGDVFRFSESRSLKAEVSNAVKLKLDDTTDHWMSATVWIGIKKYKNSEGPEADARFKRGCEKVPVWLKLLTSLIQLYHWLSVVVWESVVLDKAQSMHRVGYSPIVSHDQQVQTARPDGGHLISLATSFQLIKWCYWKEIVGVCKFKSYYELH